MTQNKINRTTSLSVQQIREAEQEKAELLRKFLQAVDNINSLPAEPRLNWALRLVFLEKSFRALRRALYCKNELNEERELVYIEILQNVFYKPFARSKIDIVTEVSRFGDFLVTSYQDAVSCRRIYTNQQKIDKIEQIKKKQAGLIYEIVNLRPEYFSEHWLVFSQLIEAELDLVSVLPALDNLLDFFT